MPEKERFPVIPATHWWSLRRKFKQSIPAAVTPGYVASALGMTLKSARSNIIPTLVRCGIIGEDGKPVQDRAIAWRDDERYAQVCEAMRKELYPQELLDAQPAPVPDRRATELWFANRTGVGSAGAKRMAVVYEILCKADPAEGDAIEASEKKPATRGKTREGAGKAADPAHPKTVDNPDELPPHRKGEDGKKSFRTPSVHIDIQVHISPDASSDQIDAIFASMARHLYEG